MKTQCCKFLLIGCLGGVLCSRGYSSQLIVPAIPESHSNSIVFQMDGVAFENWHAISNAVAANRLNRRDLTNIAVTYFLAQNPSNFALYASLFEAGKTPTNDGTFGAVPNTVWLKACYYYGSNTLLDVRFRYAISNESHLYDTILPLVRSNGDYYLTSDLEDPAVFLFEQERNQTNAWTSSGLFMSHWNGSGYFGTTNNLYKTNIEHPWVVWLPGIRFAGLAITSSSPVATNALYPESVVASAVQALLRNDTNAYLQLVCPAELDQHGAYYKVTPRDVISSQWEEARSAVSNGVALCERADFGSFAYVTYRLISASKNPGPKSWMYLKRYNGQWRISTGYNENGSSAIYYLMDSCVQSFPSEPNVLPGKSD